MIEIEDRLVATHLPVRSRRIALRRRGGLLVRSDLTHREALLLADNRMVNAVLSKRGFFKYLILTGSVVGVYRVLNKTAHTGRSITAEDNYTVRRVIVHLPNGLSSSYFEPDLRRANAYRGVKC